jgi:acetyl esterase/lipase
MSIAKKSIIIALFGIGITVIWLSAQAENQPMKATSHLQFPDTISPEARKFLNTLPDPHTVPNSPASDDVAGWKRAWEAAEAASEPKVQATMKRYEPTVKELKIGGVPALEIKPKGWKENGKVLVHLHGGGYTLYSAHSRLQSSVPAATATGLKVISIDYTVAPGGKWNKVTDEVLAALDGLQKDGCKLKDIAIYGESAGGALAASVALKMRDKGLGMPAALVLWSPWADITDRGDSAITMKDDDPTYIYDKHLKSSADAYADPKDQLNPYVSPVYGDFSKGFPPTLIQGGTREIFLSHFVRLYRTIEDAGEAAELDLYDGMPHIFQLRPEMAEAPETKAAMRKMTTFLKKHLRN